MIHFPPLRFREMLKLLSDAELRLIDIHDSMRKSGLVTAEVEKTTLERLERSRKLLKDTAGIAGGYTATPALEGSDRKARGLLEAKGWPPTA